ncbi:MAG: hypothetical protein RLZZ502_85 [Pseudomonadota bacterium]
MEGQVAHSDIGQRVDVALSRLFPEFSRSKLAELLKSGDLTVDGASPRPSSKVRGGEHVVFALPECDGEGAYVAENIPLDIVFEDDEMLVLNKPAGLVVHPGAGNWRGTLLNGLLHYFPKSVDLPRAGIVHRLDKDTTGLMVVAKSMTAQTDLVRQLQARTVHREYLAVVFGHPIDQRIAVDIGRDSVHRTKMAVRTSGGKPAATQVTVVQKFASASLLRCVLETGRTHQIRVHLSHIGHPLLGDATYCPPRLLERLPFTRQALHACALFLQHPRTREDLQFACEVPLDMQQLLERLP